VYVTATVRRLGSKRSDEPTTEFVELSASHTYTLRPLSRPEADRLAALAAGGEAADGSLDASALDFLWAQAGGHPGLIFAAVSRMATAPISAEELARDLTVRAECAHLWGQLGAEERETLLAVVVGTLESRHAASLGSLVDAGLVRDEQGRAAVFSELMADFVRRQATVQRDLPDGVVVDVEGGNVWVGGQPIEELTDLEFRLLALLYGRANKVTDKYQIVEAVWGTDYLDDVDDARIEKLISRLRTKIEPDPANPRYLLNVRGRGYKLLNV
jgi:hypothetical protein